MPVLARGGARTGRLWTYVRDDRPFGGPAPPAAFGHALGPMAGLASLHFAPDRRMGHPNGHPSGWTGVLPGEREPWPRGGRASPANAWGGHNGLHRTDRAPGPITGAPGWAHARRRLLELADIAGQVRGGRSAHEISPVALEAILDRERGLDGLPEGARLEARQRLSRPLVADLRDWLRAERARLSRHAPVARASADRLDKDRWPAFTARRRPDPPDRIVTRRTREDGRIRLPNSAAERALRGAALGRKAWLFAGSGRGGDRAALMPSPTAAAKRNDIDPQAWPADVLARIAGPPVSRLTDPLPWSWAPASDQTAA